MRIVLIFVLFCVNVHAAKSPKTEYPYKNCLSAREYITTVNFLREKKEFGLSEKEISNVADQVSSGCSKASKNFIKILSVLNKMGIDTRTSLKFSIEIANKGEDHTHAFLKVFKQVYDPEYLDLDVLTSLNLSLKLANSNDPNVKKSLKDFKNLVEFCIENKSMELSSLKCANLATDVTVIGKQFRKPISKTFIELIEFIQNDKEGPKLDRNASYQTAIKVIRNGELSSKNFKEAFIFASSKKGLKLPVADAVKFAIKISQKSMQQI